MLSLQRKGYTSQEVKNALHGVYAPVQMRFHYDLLDADNDYIRTLDNVLDGEVSSSSLAHIKRTATFSLKETVPDKPFDIGGSNLFLKSSVDDYGLVSWNGADRGTIDNTELYQGKKTIKILSSTSSGISSIGFSLRGGNQYTWSFYIKTTEAFNLGGSKIGHVQLRGADGNLHYEANEKYYPSTVQANVWTRVIITFDAPTTYDTYEWLGYIWYLTPGVTYHVVDFKVYTCYME